MKTGHWPLSDRLRGRRYDQRKFMDSPSLHKEVDARCAGSSTDLKTKGRRNYE